MNILILFLKAIITGIITGFIVSIPLGPAGIESIKVTISQGYRKGLLVVFGAISGDATYLILINCGFSNILSQSKKTESLFLIVSGIILSLIGYRSLKKGEYQVNKLASKASNPFLSGYLMVVANPMTPSLWLTVSGTSIKAWQRVGNLFYYTYMISILIAMILWFSALNFLAFKGINFFSPSNTEKTHMILKYLIILIGIGFIIFGFIMFIQTFFVGG